MIRQYIGPKYTQTEMEIAEMSDEEFAVLEEEAKRCDEFNRTVLMEAKERKMRILAEIEYIWGKDSKQYKYILRQPIPVLNRSYQSILRDQRRRGLRKLEEQQKKERKLAMEQKRLQKAIVYCQKYGLVLGTDFTVDNVFEKAAGVHYDLCPCNRPDYDCPTEDHKMIAHIYHHGCDSTWEYPCPYIKDEGEK